MFACVSSSKINDLKINNFFLLSETYGKFKKLFQELEGTQMAFNLLEEMGSTEEALVSRILFNTGLGGREFISYFTGSRGAKAERVAAAKKLEEVIKIFIENGTAISPPIPELIQQGILIAEGTDDSETRVERTVLALTGIVKAHIWAIDFSPAIKEEFIKQTLEQLKRNFPNRALELREGTELRIIKQSENLPSNGIIGKPQPAA